MSAGERMRRLVRALVEEAVASRGGTGVQRRQAIVVSVQAGPPATVTLKLHTAAPTGEHFPARYLASYASPAAGHVVFVDFMGPDPVVIGRLA